MRVIGVVGWKNSGKTDLVERLVGNFVARGMAVSTIKHAHHGLEVDTPGRDSHRHRIAGAREVIVAGGQRWALLHELRDAAEPTLPQLVSRLAPADIVLVEGFKRGPQNKIECYRAAVAELPLAAGDPTVRAVASDAPLDLDRPMFALDDTDAIAAFALATAAPLSP